MALSRSHFPCSAVRWKITEDYEVLFDEKLDLFAALLEEQPVTWKGVTRRPLEREDAHPKTTAGI